MSTPETNPLVQLSDGLADAVAKAGASTVLVAARRRIPASGVAWSADVVVTADHVIEDDENIVIGLPDGREAKATLAGRDPGSDLAVLRVEGGGLAPAERAHVVRPGHLVLAVGRPGRGEPMASFGVVSTVGGPWRTFRGGQVEGYIRSDTTFFPGFSGGPLVTAAGQVAGINSSRLWRGSGLTIPVAAAEPIVEALLSGGRLRRGYLGIGSQATRLPEALAAKAGGQASGLLIVGVEPGSPADQAGLLVGDILVRMGESAIAETDDLQAVLGPQSVGKPTPAHILRGGEPVALTVTVGERQ
ncbi:MAG: S1C family serine protease [Dehalococcoidia bacterium]|nr:S1C family serine protease [Dehalococcoidia bacterium]